MNMEISLVLITIVICITILTYRLIEVYVDSKINDAKKSEEYWKGKYFAILNAFDKALNVCLSEDYVDEVIEFINKKK